MNKFISLKDCALGESGLLQKKFVRNSLYFMLVVIDGPFEAYPYNIPVQNLSHTICVKTDKPTHITAKMHHSFTKTLFWPSCILRFSEVIFILIILVDGFGIIVIGCITFR